jgi:hypothetical protein
MGKGGFAGKMMAPHHFALILASCLGLAGCLGGAPSIPVQPTAEPPPPALGRTTPEDQEEPRPGQQALAALLDYCPPVEVKVGGPAFTIYERGGEGDPSRIRYQATFSSFPRNCTDEAGVLTIRLGIAGYLLSGARGGPGTVTLPIHVEVIQDSTVVVLDRPLPTQVTIAPGAVRGEFALVQELVVPSPPRENMRVVLSFDQPR